MTDENNPYRPPASTHTDTGSIRRVYTPLQVRIASFFGGPFAAIFTLYYNFRQLDRPDRMKLTLVLGVVFTLLLMALSLVDLPTVFYTVIALTYAVAAGSIASSTQLSADQIDSSDLYRPQSVWNVIFVCIISIVAFLITTVPFLLLLDYLGIAALV